MHGNRALASPRVHAALECGGTARHRGAMLKLTAITGLAGEPVQVRGVVVGDLGGDINRGKTGLSLAFGVERADPYQPVHSHLTLEVAIGPGTANGDRGILDSRDIVVLPVEQFDVVVVFTGPRGIHPQQHLRPVIGIGAAVAGVEREDRIQGVVGAREKRCQLQCLDERLKPLGLACQLCFERFVFCRQFGQGFDVAAHCQGFIERLEDRVDSLQLCNRGLSFFAVVPEIALTHLGFDAGSGFFASFPVKESPAAGASGPGWLRSG